MKVSNSDFPRKSNLAIAHEAAMPKATLSGTVITATSRVKRTAARVSGSLSEDR